MTKPEDADEGFDLSDCSPSFRDMYRLTGERVEKRATDSSEYESVRQAAEDALRLLNGCMDSGMRARGFTKWFRSGNATFRLHLQCVETVNVQVELAIIQLDFQALLQKLSDRAGQLALMTVRQLRTLHPDNEDGTVSGLQWNGIGRDRLIADILFEEFSE